MEDSSKVLHILNLFKNPFATEELLAKIQNGVDFTLEFEYDFDQVSDNTYYTTQHKNTMILEVHFVAIRNKKGTIIGHLLLSNDLTATKKAEFHTEESKKTWKWLWMLLICLRGSMM